jgi:hypothetical protein
MNIKGEVKMKKHGKYAKLDNGTVIPIETDETEWLLRYGSEEEIIKNRLYIASIVNAYKNKYLLNELDKN